MSSRPRDGHVFWLILFAIACAVAVWLLSGPARAESGTASVYAVPGKDRYAGRRGACGERISPGALTAAHRTARCGSSIRVTNKRNGRAVTVRINDRGPFVRGRVIDLTPAGASALGFSGLAPVKLQGM